MATLAEFARQLEDSGLVEPSTLKGILAKQQPLRSAGDLARELIKQKQLTNFQAQRVYDGKGSSLLLGNYTILDQIGAGGMGQVYKARHRRMDRIVAVKMLPPEVAKEAAAQARFQREVQAAAKLAHQNIVAAYDADLVGDSPFLVMEFVDGIDLSALVRRSGPLPLAKAVGCVLQAARGLDYAHKQGIIHRDIKPSNLLVDKTGRVKILDMGLARMDSSSQALVETQSELTGTGNIVGTIDYMAPEQALGSKLTDHRSDIYSLGCTLYFLLTGKPPYEGDTAIGKLLAHREQPIPSLASVQPPVPPALDAVFRRMVAKNPDDRFQSTGELIAALQELGKASPGRPAPPPVAGEGRYDAEPGISGLNLCTAETPFRGGSGLNLATEAPPQGGSGLNLPTEAPPPTGGSSANLAMAPSPRPDSGAEPPTKRTGRWPRQKTAIVAAGIGASILIGGALLLKVSRSGPNGDPTSSKPADPTTVATNSAAGGSGNQSSAHGGQQPTDVDRQVAQWVRTHANHALKIAVGNGQPAAIDAGSPLPQSAFKVFAISIVDAPVSEAEVASLAPLGELRELRLERAALSDSTLAKLPALLTLETLSVAGNTGIGDEGMKVIARETGLRWLDVSATSPTLAGLKNLQPLAELSRLNLSNVKLDGQWLAPVAKFAKLRLLELNGTPLGDDDLVGLAGQRLTVLDLDRTRLTDNGLRGLPVLVPGLHHLSIQETNITAAGVAAFKQAAPDCLVDWSPVGGSQSATSVTPPPTQSPTQPPAADPDRVAAVWVLSVQATAKLTISEAGAPAHLLPQGAPLPPSPFKIVEISLADASLPNADLSHLNGLNELQRLAIQRCDLPDTVLATLPPLAKLENLDLAGNRRLTDASLKSLGNRTGLRNVNLSNTGITSAGLGLLSESLSHLEWIDVSGTAVTLSGITNFEKAEPRCIIDWTPPAR